MPDLKQIVTKLTPLADVFAMLNDLAKPVPAQPVAVGDAADGVLADDVRTVTRPKHATALTDGWAVAAIDVADASSYAPIALSAVPPRVETGDDMPQGADAVLPPDAIVLRGASAEVSAEACAETVASAAPGEGVLAPGGDSDAAKPLYRAGQALRSSDLAVLAAADVSNVSLRVPRVVIVAAREDLRLVPAAQFVMRDCAARGGRPQLRNGVDIDDAFKVTDADLVVIVGGTGSGTRDGSVIALAQAGRVACHGVGIAPGETAALGAVAGRPVLILPGRLDAALGAWLLVGRPLFDRLSGRAGTAVTAHGRLTRKIASTVGLCELVPVRHADGTEGEVEPLAGKVLPLSVLARATGYVVVPADSEGYAAGSEVAVHGWP
jgi:molybdopterin biosynthesis enzyme